MCRFEVYVILCVGACMFAFCGLLIKIIGLPANIMAVHSLVVHVRL